MIDAPDIEEWLRDEARRKAAEAKASVKNEGGLTPFETDTFRSGGKEGKPMGRCPSCGLTEGRHAYYCAIAYPDEDEEGTT